MCGLGLPCVCVVVEVLCCFGSCNCVDYMIVVVVVVIFVVAIIVGLIVLGLPILVRWEVNVVVVDCVLNVVAMVVVMFVGCVVCWL